MRSLNRRQALSLFGVSAVGLFGLAACGGDDEQAAGGEQAAGKTRAEGEKITLTFWSWVPGIDKAVDLWNKQNPEVQVKFERTGGKDVYPKMLASIKAGQAPDLAQVEYATIPSFLVANGLVDLAGHGAADVKDKFVDWQWQQGAVGESVFAIPQASGPMGMFYREDLFKEWGIEPPATWDEFAVAAKKVREADPKAYLCTFSPSGPSLFTGLAWQAGAKWFSLDGENWSVNIDSAETQKVTDFWQKLIADDLVKTIPDSQPEWYSNLQDGTIGAWVAGQWGDAIIEGNAPETAGKWRVAAMPAWDAAKPTSGNHGGSSTAVLTGCEYPAEALKFAVWLNTDPDSVNLLLKGGYGWPASKDALETTTLNEPSEFFGGQAYNEVFAEMDTLISADWQWPPSTIATNEALTDGFQKAVAGDGTLTDALPNVQKATIQDLKDKAIPVADS